MPAKSIAHDRVLLVEDDPDAAELVCEILEAEGFKCFWLRRDRDAIQTLEEGRGLRALVVDINLGAGTTGFDVARIARQVMPNLPVVYISGKVLEASFRAFGVPDSQFVEKPFTAEGFLEAFRAAMNGHAAGA